jgi:hypothetical protein
LITVGKLLILKKSYSTGGTDGFFTRIGGKNLKRESDISRVYRLIVFALFKGGVSDLNTHTS